MGAPARRGRIHAAALVEAAKQRSHAFSINCGRPAFALSIPLGKKPSCNEVHDRAVLRVRGSPAAELHIDVRESPALNVFSMWRRSCGVPWPDKVVG